MTQQGRNLGHLHFLSHCSHLKAVNAPLNWLNFCYKSCVQKPLTCFIFCTLLYLKIKEGIALSLNQRSNVLKFTPLKIKFNVTLLLACVNYILKYGDRGHLNFSFRISCIQRRCFSNWASRWEEALIPANLVAVSAILFIKNLELLEISSLGLSILQEKKSFSSNIIMKNQTDSVQRGSKVYSL